MENNRLCPRCGILKPAVDYFKNKSKKSGLGTYCKQCAKVRKNEYRSNHLEECLKKDSERAIKWYHLHEAQISERRHNHRATNPEWTKKENNKHKEYYASHKSEIALRRHNFHLEHKEEHNAKALNYCHSHKEERLKYNRWWLKTHPIEHRAQVALRKMRKKLATITGSGITTKQFLQMCQENNGYCSYCGKKAPLEMDHVVPLIKGGMHDVDNIVPACKSCNSSKHAEDLVMWLYRIHSRPPSMSRNEAG